MKSRVAAAVFFTLLAWVFTGPFLGVPVMLIFGVIFYQDWKSDKQKIQHLRDNADDDITTDWDRYSPMSINGIALDIRYTDSDGNKSSRVVDVYEFDPLLYGCVIKGHCRLRDDIRTFRGDRIDEIIDTSTGEIITDIGSFLLDAVNKTEKKPRRRKNQT